jgi:hypothetical protein
MIIVEYSNFAEMEARPESTPGSINESRQTASTDWCSNESATLRSSPLRQFRSFQEQVANGAGATLLVNNTQATDNLSPVTTRDRVRVIQDVMPTQAPRSPVVLPEWIPMPCTNHESQAILNERIIDQVRADNESRMDDDAHVGISLARQEEHMRLATQLVERQYLMQMVENRAAIQLAETEADMDARLSTIQ